MVKIVSTTTIALAACMIAAVAIVKGTQLHRYMSESSTSTIAKDGSGSIRVIDKEYEGALTIMIRRRLIYWIGVCIPIFAVSHVVFSIVLYLLSLMSINRISLNAVYRMSVIYLYFLGLLLLFTSAFYYDFEFYKVSKFFNRIRLVVLITVATPVGVLFGYLMQCVYTSQLSMPNSQYALKVSILTCILTLFTHVVLYWYKSMNEFVLKAASSSLYSLFYHAIKVSLNDSLAPAAYVAISTSVLQLLYYYYPHSTVIVSSNSYTPSNVEEVGVWDIVTGLLATTASMDVFRSTEPSLLLLVTTFIKSYLSSCYLLLSLTSCYRILYILLSYPLNYADNARSLCGAASSYMIKRANVEEFLYHAISVAGLIGPYKSVPWSKSNTSTTRSNVTLQKTLFSSEINELCGYNSTEMLNSLVPTILGSIAMPYMTGTGRYSIRNRLCVWGQCLALQDLNVLSRASPSRRAGLLHRDKGVWSEIIIACCAVLDATTIQMQCITAEAVDILKKSRSCGIENNYKGMIEKYFLRGDYSWTASKAVMDMRIRSTAYSIVSDMLDSSLIRNIIHLFTGESLNVCDDPLPTCALQMTSHATEALSLSMHYALKEDSLGLTLHHISSIVNSILGLHIALKVYVDVVKRFRDKQYQHAGSGSTIGGSAAAGVARLYNLSLVSPEISSLIRVNDESLSRILLDYQETLRKLPLSGIYASELQEKIILLNKS